MTGALPDGRAHVAAPGAGRVFPRDLLAGPTLTVARALLGAVLVRDPPAGGSGRRAGRIVEVEAYIGVEDRASHARMGPTPRNRVMFGPPGIAYVYLVYGMHHCLNVVTEPAPRPAAVLIRAVEPLAGVEAMREAQASVRVPRARPGTAPRDTSDDTRRQVADARLTAGPGLVAAAFGLDRSHTGIDLCDPASALRLELAPGAGPGPEAEVIATPRIGIRSAGEPWTSVPWRLLLADSPSVSRRG